MSSLVELLERVKAATGADREIDAAIGSMVRYHPYGPFHWINKSPEAVYSPTHAGWMGFTLPGEDTPRDAWASPEYTASIDAALALTERVLNDTPGVTRYPVETTISSVGLEGPWRAAVWIGGESDGRYFEAPSAPLAILAATLQALIAKEAQ